MHRSVSMSYVKICVDVTQYVKLLDLAKSQSGVTHLESIWSGQVIFEDGQSHRALTYFGVSRIRGPWTREVFKTMLGLLIHLRGRSSITYYKFGVPSRQACSPLIQLFFGFASDIDQTNVNRDIRDGNWLSSLRMSLTN